MSSGFTDFADAMARPARSAPIVARAFRRIAVLGGGPDARLLAAICLSEGAEVTLFSAYGEELAALRSGAGIALRGSGPVGSYQIDSEAAPSVKTTAELDVAVKDADLIFLTGPVHKQRTYAMVLADHLSDGQVLVLAPGRSMGALEARWLLQIGGCSSDITLVEAQTLPFWFTASGATLNLSASAPSSAATLPAGRTDVLDGLRQFLPNIAAAISTIHSGFADGSALVELPALVLGGPSFSPGGPNIPMGGEVLPENQSFRNLIGPEQMTIINDLAAERIEVARHFGIRDLPGAAEWLDIHAGVATGEGSRPIPTQDQAKGLIRDGVIGSLAPLSSAASIAGVSTPVTNAMIALASSVLKADLSTAGRKLQAIGVDADNIDAARNQLASIAGQR